jgi:hypothetical protein
LCLFSLGTRRAEIGGKMSAWHPKYLYYETSNINSAALRKLRKPGISKYN